MKRYILKYLVLSLVVTLFLPLQSSVAGNLVPEKNIEGVIRSKVKLSQEHKSTDLGYNLSRAIPMGGVHNPAWATCKAYATYVAPEYAIHSMEHGAIWIAYDSKLKSSEIEKLSIKDFIKRYQNSSTTPELGAPCQNGLSDTKLLLKAQSVTR